MFSTLVTLEVSEKPQVLVVGKGTFFEETSVFLEKNELEPTRVAYDAFGNLGSKKLDLFYKIFIVLDEKTRVTGRFFTELERVQKKTALICLFGDNPESDKKKLEFLTFFLKKYPRISSVVGFDILGATFRNRLFDDLFEREQKQHEKLKIPNRDFYFQSWESFLIKAGKVFLSPWRGQRVAIKGKKVDQIKVRDVLSDLLKVPKKEFFLQEGKQDNLSLESLEFDSEEGRGKENFEDILKKYAETQFPQLVKEKQFLVESNFPKPTYKKKEDTKKIEPRKAPKVEKGVEKTEELVFSKEVQKIFDKQQVTHKVERTKKLSEETKKIRRKTQRKKRVFLGGMVITGVALGLLFLVVLFSLSIFSLKKQLIRQLQTVSSQTAIDSKWFSRNLVLAEVQTAVYSKFLGQSLLKENQQIIEASRQYLEAKQNQEKLEKIVIQGFKSVVGSESGDAFSLFQAAEAESRKLYQQLSLLEATLESFGKGREEELVGKITQSRKSLASFQQLQPLFSSLLGKNSKKTYAILIQDNQELRPTGGFISGVMFVTLENGLIIDHQVFSIYELDKKMVGSIEPPKEITKYLGEEKWFLRDINWDGDFPTTAKNATKILEKISSRKIDGVIGINLYVIQDLIKATGPVEVPEFNEVLTDKNLFERAEFHSEIKLVDDQQKRDYLPLIFQKVFERILLIGEDKIPALLSEIETNLSQNQIAFATDDSSVLSSIAALGWSGELLSPTCPVQLDQGNCFVDYFMMVEANVGVNKANYSLSKQIDHQIMLDEAQITHTRKTTFINNAHTNAWPQGTYKSFIRVYVPTQARLSSIKIGDQDVSLGETTQKIVHNKKEIGFYLEVPIQAHKEVVISYYLPTKTTAPFSYAFFEQKQPGTVADSEQITVTQNQADKPKLIAPQAEVEGNSIVFSPKEETHTFLGVTF